jgi:hypothetical protein
MGDVEPARAVAMAAAVGLLAIVGFQLALAFGAPLGRAAWGGSHDRLPGRLRVGSAIAAVIWVLGAAVVLARGGFDISPVPATAARWGTWVLVVMLSVGALMNFASRSRWERFIWGPVALLLAGLCLVLALGPAR